MSDNNDSASAHEPPVAVAAYTDRGEAEVALAHLRGEGIEGFIVDEVEGGVLPVNTEAGVVVAVHGQDAETARAILDTGE